MAASTAPNMDEPGSFAPHSAHPAAGCGRGGFLLVVLRLEVVIGRTGRSERVQNLDVEENEPGEGDGGRHEGRHGGEGPF